MSASRTVASPRAPRRTTPTTVGWIAVIIFVFLAGVGAIAALAAVGAYLQLTKGLDSPAALTDYVLPQETIIYDRTGKIELARFGEAKREVVTFDEIPKVLLDATTAVEDKTFWENAGFDPVAIASAALDSLRGSSRGASTITQQLVRQRLLDPALVQDPTRTAERKLKEIIQSIRVTQYFAGAEGKQDIITAYLNQNYYGNQSYGVKAAVRTYFGIDISKIDPAQAAIIAGLPKSPSNYDLVRNHIEQCTTVVAEGEDCPKSQLVVPRDTTVVQRRNQILELLAAGRTPMSGDQYTAAQFKAAEDEPVVLGSQATPRWIAPHFVWAVRDELATKLCGDEPTCDALDLGGLRVTTTLDVGLQKIAEKWVQAAAIVPNKKNMTAAAKALGFKKLEPWMANLKSKDLHNGALVAVDYQTGELVAYVGSADYYATSNKKDFQPQYDVAGKGYRQPGSAFKPFNYAVGINDKTITAGTMLMDVGTDFGGGYTPNDADRLERGPVRVRNALQFSLNIPAVKTMALNKPDHVFAKAQEFGMDFQGTRKAELALALGVQEVRPVDLVTAYGTLANGGKEIPHTTILAINNADGTPKQPPYVPPAGKQVVSPQAAFIVTDILAGNTNKSINPFWGKFAITGPDGRRPATLKTGTNNDAKDLNAYGYIAPPTEQGRSTGAYALAVGVWNGNSDNSLVSTAGSPLFSIDVSTYVWQGFLNEATAKWPETNFKRPADGLVQAKIDPWTGQLASSDKFAVNEWFIAGTQPHDKLPSDTCGIDVVVRVHVETGFDAWLNADRDWLRRAARGPGVAGGPDRTRTAYFYQNGYHPYGASWGALVGGSCKPAPSPTCFALPTPDAGGVVPSFAVPTPSGSEQAALPCPPASPSASPSEIPSTEPSLPPSEPPPTPGPTPEPTPEPTPAPTPPPTPAPTPTPAAPTPVAPPPS
jgi:membrane peptidoglycan carboxypeptidase